MVELRLYAVCRDCPKRWSPLLKRGDRAMDRAGANRLHQRAYNARQHAAVHHHRVTIQWTRREEYTP